MISEKSSSKPKSQAPAVNEPNEAQEAVASQIIAQSPKAQNDQEQHNAMFNPSETLNDKAVSSPQNYVNNHANNNWFQVLHQFQQGTLHHEKGTSNTKPYGMDALIQYRKKITQSLLTWVIVPAKDAEKVARAQMFKAKYPNEEVPSELIENLKPVKGNVPGSNNPTSDIDVNMSGDGTEHAVTLLNEKFKKEYGNGEESGVVYDVNFYAQDFVPGKMFGLKKAGELERKDNEDKQAYFDNDEAWRTHVVTDEDEIKRDQQDQQEASMLMMRVNMQDEDWNVYKANAPQSMQTTIENVELKYKNRQEAIDNASSDHKVIKAGTDDDKDDELSSMQAENALYEEVLTTKVKPARIAFKILEAQVNNMKANNVAVPSDVQKELDKAYVDLKMAKTEAMAYANAAYYSEGAVVSIVTNKQQLGKMYKDKTETDENGNVKIKKNFKKLKLTKHEYYNSFNEQIGFALHGLHKAHGDAFYAELPLMGKYVHRSYNMIKHLFKVSGVAFPRQESERRAASDWEGVKQLKVHTENDGYTQELDKDNATQELRNVIKNFLGGSLPDSEAAIATAIKKHLIALKIDIDTRFPQLISDE